MRETTPNFLINDTDWTAITLPDYTTCESYSVQSREAKQFYIRSALDMNSAANDRWLTIHEGVLMSIPESYGVAGSLLCYAKTPTGTGTTTVELLIVR
jgi:hypothetical protein